MSHTPPTGTELVEAIGCGTTFDVAIVRREGRMLVSKRIRTALLREPAARATIVREAKVLAAVRHAALPSLVEVGSDASGPFLLETRAEGTSARELVEGWRYLGRGVPARLVAHLAEEATRALAELAELADERGPLGFVHGDLGPDHVVLGPLGQIRFVDFGASRARDVEPGLERGTLPFVAPEVARGELAPDARADVYALAATIVFLAIGGPIVRARDEAAMLLEIGERGIAREVIARADLDARARDVLTRALDRDPSARPSARELAEGFATPARDHARH